MRHRAGVSIGVMNGSSAETDGITGIAALYSRRLRSLHTKGNIPEIGTRALSSSNPFKTRITDTSQRTPSYSSAIKLSARKVCPRSPRSKTSAV